MRGHHFNATSLAVPWLLVGTVSADAQSRPRPIEEIRAPEAFVHIGGFRPGVFELNQSDVGRITSFRGGVAAFPIPRLGLRGDVYMAGWHLGARIGGGYRF